MSIEELTGLPARSRVLISGGGPSGLFLALDLAHYGIPSVVVDRRRDIDGDRPRAKTTNARTMTHLRRLGLADTLRAAAPLAVDYSQDVIFCTSVRGHEITRFRNAFQLDTRRYDPQPECGQQVGQPVVEAVLRHAAAASELVTLCVGASVAALEKDADGYTSVVRDETGAERTIGGDYLIGADGGASAVRKFLGIRLEGASAARPNVNVLFRSRQLAGAVTMGPAVQYWITNPRAPGMLGPLDLDGTWWAIFQGVDAADTEADPVPKIRAMVGADVDVEVVAKDPWTARMLLAERYRSGNAFLVGDAAHLNPPWGGHGFNTCIGDAANLAWKLAATIDGWAGPAVLDSYEAERRPVAARTIADAAANGQALAYDFADDALLVDDADGAAARARAATKLNVKSSEFHSLGLVLGYAYPDSPIIDSDDELPADDPIHYTPSAAPGCLLPHTWVGDASIYDALDTGFTLLYDARAAEEDTFAAVRRIAGDHDVPLTIRGIDSRLEAAWGAPAVLVRPDQHVTWRGLHGAGDALLYAAGQHTAHLTDHCAGGVRI